MRWSVVVGLLGLAAGAAPLAARPPNPVNLTVIGLRPTNLSASLVNKDTGDAAGDLFFWITDRLVAPYACRVSQGKWWGCHEQGTLDHDSVYTQTVLEVNGNWPTNTSLGSCIVNTTVTSQTCFAPCNPVDKSGRDWECSCRNASGTAPHSGASAPCNIVGRAYLSQRFAGECTDGCHYPNDYWKTAVAERLGGLWYSTPVEAQCNTDASVSCQWRELAKIKVVNASCANANVLRYVEREGEACFAGCTPADRADPTSDCATLCFFETLLGKGANFPNSTSPGLSGTAVVAAFAAAFESDDPAQGGCKDVRSGPEAGISA